MLITPLKTWPLKLLMAAGIACMFGGPLILLAIDIILHMALLSNVFIYAGVRRVLTERSPHLVALRRLPSSLRPNPTEEFQN